MRLKKSTALLSYLLWPAIVAAFAVIVPRLEAAESPVARHYRDGETLRYTIDGDNSDNGVANDGYHAAADVVVKKDANGVFHEEFQWSDVKNNGKDETLPPEVRDYRQLLSLDLAYKFGLPDLQKIGAYLGGQSTDAMTFYVDDRLAIGRAELRKPGDHVRIPFGKPASWARQNILTGYDCIDFEVAVVAVSSASVTLSVRHVPPPAICGDVPADWMKKPVADTVNNWFQVEKKNGVYEAASGKEVFDATVVVLLPSGVISSATMYNPVLTYGKTCKDAALTDCGPLVKEEILRKIKFSLVQ